MKLLQNIAMGLGIGFACLVLAGCSPKQQELPPTDLPPTDLPQAPNCAADGPGCKQFNPDKPVAEKGSNY